MYNIEVIIIFTIISLAIDKIPDKLNIKKFLNIGLISIVLSIENFNIITALPIGFCALLYLNNLKISAEKLKLIALASAAFTIFNDHYWSVLILILLYLVNLRIVLEQKKSATILIVDAIYTLTLFFLGLFLIWVQRDISSTLYVNFQLPAGIGLLIVTLFRSFNVLGSIKVMQAQSLGLKIGDKLLLQIIQNFYIPLQLILIIRGQISLLGKDQIINLSIFSSVILLISAVKHLYEIKYVQRSIPDDALLFNYYGAIFFSAALFVEGQTFHHILVSLVYILVIYSVMVIISTKWSKFHIKTLLFLLLIPTPISLLFYQAIKVYNQLISANFTLMSSTFILLLVCSFLLRPQKFGKYNLNYE